MDKRLKQNHVLGIWDGHDAGAALVKGDKIVFAVNEERFTRRKLEAGFPSRSIKACLEYAGIPPSAVADIAASTSDPAKTLTRLSPRLKEEYYLMRRRKKGPGRFNGLKKGFKYRFTELGPNFLSTRLSRRHLNNQLKKNGFKNYRLHLVDHHSGHAQAAARCSGFEECLVITLDGVGDGLSGSIWTFGNNKLELIKKIPSKVSMGIFFEHVTNLMNMRELEDEGKVMALANYAYPVDDADNPIMNLIRCENLQFVSNYRSIGMFKAMKKIFWRYPSEQFAFMAQRVLEKRVIDLVKDAVTRSGLNKTALAGGLFSNIKLNMKAGELDEIENLYVFPHPGDGGLAIGSALAVNHRKYGIPGFKLNDLYLGPAFTHDEILAALRQRKVSFKQIKDVARTAAALILDNEIILWFRGRVEIGPRALGNRSILARPDDRRIRDRLNLALKKRVWYQPFCPSILLEDASALLHTEKQGVLDNPFMTSAFRVRNEHLNAMAGVINVDSTCRPHFVADENPVYRDLLVHIKKELGMGVVLNTSFNIHGEPLVCSPDDALDTFVRTGVRYLFLEDFLIENRS